MTDLYCANSPHVNGRAYCPARGGNSNEVATVDLKFVYEVATRLRDEDQQEVAQRPTIGHDACTQSWAMSDIRQGIETDDGVPCGLNRAKWRPYLVTRYAGIDGNKEKTFAVVQRRARMVEYCVKTAGRRGE